MLWSLLKLTVFLPGVLVMLLAVYWFFVDVTQPFICTYQYDGHCEIMAHDHYRPEPLWKQIVGWGGLVLFCVLFLLGGLQRFGF